MRQIILQWSFQIRMHYQNLEMQPEQFSNHCRKQNKANENEASNQSEHEADKCKPQQAREICGRMR